MITEQEGFTLAQALKMLGSRVYPADLSFDLSAQFKAYDSVTNLNAIIKTLELGCPSGLKILLNDNHIKTTGALAIAELFLSNKCPLNLHLELQYNFIDDMGFIDIIDSMSKKPTNFSNGYLGLGFNYIGNYGARELAKKLKSDNWPENFSLDLKGNCIGNEGAESLIDALQSIKKPLINFTLNLEENLISEKLLKKIDILLGKSKPIDIDLEQKNSKEKVSFFSKKKGKESKQAEKADRGCCFIFLN